MSSKLTQDNLARTLFPLGELTKPEVRRIALQHGYEKLSQKGESQEICFIPDNDYRAFLNEEVEDFSEKYGPGDFVDTQGNYLGRHKGFPHYTIGQRKGLGISFGVHRYVSALDAKKNTVTLSDESAVFSKRLEANDLQMIAPVPSSKKLYAEVKIRYAHRPAPAWIHFSDNGWVQVEFEQPQRAVTKGQAAVFLLSHCESADT